VRPYKINITKIFAFYNFLLILVDKITRKEIIMRILISSLIRSFVNKMAIAIKEGIIYKGLQKAKSIMDMGNFEKAALELHGKDGNGGAKKELAEYHKGFEADSKMGGPYGKKAKDVIMQATGPALKSLDQAVELIKNQNDADAGDKIAEVMMYLEKVDDILK